MSFRGSRPAELERAHDRTRSLQRFPRFHPNRTCSCALRGNPPSWTCSPSTQERLEVRSEDWPRIVPGEGHIDVRQEPPDLVADIVALARERDCEDVFGGKERADCVRELDLSATAGLRVPDPRLGDRVSNDANRFLREPPERSGWGVEPSCRPPEAVAAAGTLRLAWAERRIRSDGGDLADATRSFHRCACSSGTTTSREFRIPRQPRRRGPPP